MLSTPSLGGAWIASTSRPESMSYSVVVVAPATLLVYAAATTTGAVPAPASPAL